MIDGFKKFLMRGNVVDLAVAVVMGAAFTAVVNSLVKNLLMPLVTAIFGKQDYTDLTFKIHKSVFYYGSFITDLIAFICIAAAVYYAVVMPLNLLAEKNRARKGTTATPEPTETEKELLAQIRDLLQDRPQQLR